MHLIEIYRSVQGESSWSGVPCIFVRLAGCNLRCSWCDSTYTFSGGKKMTEDEVMAEVVRLAPVKLIEITGGEPMLQERELVPCMQRLLNAGYTVLLETSGERALESVPSQVHKIVDVKCPGSGEGGSFRMENLSTLTAGDELKFVLRDRVDYEFARDFVHRYRLTEQVRDVLFSPAFRVDVQGRTAENFELDPQLLVDWLLKDGLGVRLNLQIHKFIWEPQTKGV